MVHREGYCTKVIINTSIPIAFYTWFFPWTAPRWDARAVISVLQRKEELKFKQRMDGRGSTDPAFLCPMSQSSCDTALARSSTDFSVGAEVRRGGQNAEKQDPPATSERSMNMSLGGRKAGKTRPIISWLKWWRQYDGQQAALTEQAKQENNKLLGRIGHASYLDFLMYSSL